MYIYVKNIFVDSNSLVETNLPENLQSLELKE